MANVFVKIAFRSDDRRLRPKKNDDDSKNGAKSSVVKIVALLLDVFVVVFSLSLFLSDTKYSISLSRALAQDVDVAPIRGLISTARTGAERALEPGESGGGTETGVGGVGGRARAPTKETESRRGRGGY